MRVTTLRRTPKPEQLVCQTARGDYYDGFVPEADYDELMGGVSYDDRHEDAVREVYDIERIPGTGGGEYALIRETDKGVIASDENVHYPNVETMFRQYAFLEREFKRGHFGIWEHPQITFAVEGMSRVTMAQITRHRQVSFDVQSMRYVDFTTKDKDERVRKPSSIRQDDTYSRETGTVDFEDIKDEYVESSYEDLVDECFDWYDRMVDHGMPKEDARFALPLGTVVNMSCSMNARAFLHIEDIRGKGGGDAQSEIQEMTNALSDEFADWMPMTAHIYDQHGPHRLAP